MALMQMLVFVAVGGLLGWIAGVAIRAERRDILLNVAVGILGALLGGWVLGTAGIGATGPGAMFLMATVGAASLLALLRLLTRS
jgi:uncharacterized membrane protein YeaQ/YmgE (transglycosylase-associated protein family)